MSHDMNVTPYIVNSSITRRRALGVVGALGMIASSGRPVLALQGDATPAPTEAELIEVTMPDWRFGLLSVVDPYVGELTKPSGGVPGGFKIIGCQVVLTNMSDQPMDFSLRDVRARDSEGVEYQAGDYVGTEPDIVSQNLPDGERARGWVWFGIPEETQLASTVFIAPRPILRIPMG